MAGLARDEGGHGRLDGIGARLESDDSFLWINWK